MDQGTEPFELVAEPTRAAILQTLAASHGESPGDPGLSFSELRERVGREDSGNFSYHLDKLGEQFVRKTDGGYVLTDSGLRVVGAIRSARAAAGELDRGPEDLGESCPVCGAELTATYEGGTLRVACPEGHFFPATRLPPGALEGRSTGELIELAVVAAGNDLELLRQGACPRCYAGVDLGVYDEDRPASPVRYRFRAACDRCGMIYGGPVGTCVLRDPRVVGHFADRDVEVTTEPLWRFDVWSEEAVTVASEDPLRLRVAVAHDAGRIDVTVDDDGAVRSTDPVR